MPTIPRSRAMVLGIAAVLGVALVAPAMVRAQETNVVMAPDDADSVPGIAGVRWAPDRTIGPESSRVAAARDALRSGDLGSMQEAALSDLVSGSAAVDASGDGAAAAVSPASPAPLPTDLAIAIATGTRGETAHLATIPLPSGVVGSGASHVAGDNRIAITPCGSS